MRVPISSLRSIALVLAISSVARGDTTINGSALALRSSGLASGVLSQNGYFGTYVTLAAPGSITFTANASGVASNGVNPDLTVSIADYSRSFAVSPSGSNAYAYASPVLPAGTYFVRTQLDNHETVLVNGAPVVANTALTLNTLTISANATVSNAATDANALAAANTYIDHFRKGDATVTLAGATAGASVHVRLRSNAFNLGAGVPGTTLNANDNYLAANPAAGTNAAYFQKFLAGQASNTNPATFGGDRFNSIEPTNAGKWTYHESSFASDGTSTSTPTLGPVDQMMAYAQANGLSARQHNVIWGGGNQQPAQVKTWVTDAASGSATAAASRTSLQKAIANRINYYIAGANSVNGKARASAFDQLDVLNEALQTGPYFNALGGYAGVAAVYKQAQDAVKAAGLTTKLYTNEYNVLQNSPITVTPSSGYGTQGAATYGDVYANWYRNEVEGINNAAIAAGAGGNVVTGIGAQYYPTTTGTRGPNVLQSALQNLSVEGLPISIPEFGAQTSFRSGNVAGGAVPHLIDDTIRMAMGTPLMDSLLIWGFYDDGTAATNPYGGGSVLINKGWVNADGSWNLTAAGVRFEYLYGRGLDPTAPGANADGSNPDPLTTDVTVPINADGTIRFNGFYGDYDVIVGGKTYALAFDKGTAQYTLVVPEPCGIAAIATTMILGRRRRSRSAKPVD